MRINKTILLAVASVLIGINVSAKPVEPSRARAVAARILPQADLTVTPLGNTIYLVCPAEGAGFVLVSADDCVVPVLAWSTDGTFPTDEMPAHVQAWVDGYSADISARRDEAAVAPPEVHALWEGNGPKDANVGAVAPMLTTTWSQSPRYNAMCPANSNGQHAVTGCVATATAQIMKYWNHPHRGRGSHQYYSSFGRLSADFDTIYPWNDMPSSLGWGSSSTQIDAVALLMYHVGVAVDMNYGVGSSGAQILETYGASSERALKRYFRYSTELYGLTKAGYTDHEWDSIMLVEMSYGRPVLYTGFGTDAGHAFVVDGCSTNHNSTTGNRYFHINWGWGGAYDGYFTLDALTPGGGGTGSSSSNSYSSGCQALIGIKPVYNSLGDSLALIQVVSADTATGTVSGNGIYVVDVDSVAVWATPAPGYRFDRWASGSTLNPILGLADGDFVDTAIFVPLFSDSLRYSDERILNAINNTHGDTTWWAMRIPADMRAKQRKISTVDIGIYGGAYYNLSIYQGDTICEATRLYSRRTFFVGRGWHTFVIDRDVVVDNSRPLWVTVYNDGSEHVYCAAGSHYTGIPDGSWYYDRGHWKHYEGDRWLTWMIRANFTPRDSVECNVTLDMAYRDDTLGLPLPDYCNVSGEGTFAEGTTVTVSASAGTGDTLFRYWLTPWGSKIWDNPYTFVADYNLHLTAVYGSLLGINDVDDDRIAVRVIGRSVSVDAPQGTAVAAYDLQGRQVAAGQRFTVPSAGVYVVRVGATAKKIIVY